MRSIVLASILLIGVTPAVVGQTAHSGDAALIYHWVRTNTLPRECGCFDLNGGAVSGSWALSSRWNAVAEFSAEHTGDALSTGKSLTLTSYLAGARYRVPQPWSPGPHSPQPFAQLLLGAGHANGSVAGSGEASTVFATRIGGGIDLPVNSSVTVRIIQVDYYLTNFANAANNHQNNLLLGAGIAFRWSWQK